jgi:hypothetical protein
MTDAMVENVARIIEPWAFGVVANIGHTEMAARARDLAMTRAATIHALYSERMKGLENDAEFWCRTLGEAIDALDQIAAREISDDEELDYRDEASEAVEGIRAKYKARPVSVLPNPDETTSGTEGGR